MCKKIDKEQINIWIERAYENAKKHGWHNEDKSDRHWLMMIGTEIAEAVQADRKNRYFDELTQNGLECVLANDHHGGLFEHFYEDNIEGTVESELADICIRIFDFMGLKGFSMKYDIDLASNHVSRFRTLTFTEACFVISSILFSDRMLNIYQIYDFLCIIIVDIFLFANSLNIDLKQQIELKMRYNESRAYMHGGKKY